MPMLTRYVASVQTKSIYRDPISAVKRIPKGTRYEVHLRETFKSAWGELVYTLDALKASLCLQAQKTGTPITVATRETKFGNEIVTVELGWKLP